MSEKLKDVHPSVQEEAEITLDLAKRLISNIITFTDMEDENWVYLSKKLRLSGNKLTLSFELKEDVLRKEKIKRDKLQRRVTDPYSDVEEELEHIPE